VARALYKLISGTAQEIDQEIAKLAELGWKPILMSTAVTTPPGATPQEVVRVYVILEMY
jgi:hypothetical protein